MSPRLEAIVAMGSNRVIGFENRLPWRLPEDLKRFKALTMGQILLMGRKTYQSIGRPLPGRTTWVLTHQHGWSAPNAPEVVSFRSIEAALEAATLEKRRVIVAGGEAIYRLTLPWISRIYITLIDRAFEGDSYFPEVDFSRWVLEEELVNFDRDLAANYYFRTWRALPHDDP